MRTVIHFSFARLLYPIRSPCPIPSSAYLRVHPRLIHQSSILTAPIEKRPASPFARFVKEMYHEVSQLEEKAKTPRVMEMLANKWKVMPEEEKEKYTLDYMEDRKEWVKNYENSTEEEKVAFLQKGKLKKEKKNSKKKKRVVDPWAKINSMTVFKYERYYTLRRDFPALKLKEIFKLLVYEWKKLPQAKKERYDKFSAAMRAKASENTLVYTFMELYDECYVTRPGESIYF